MTDVDAKYHLLSQYHLTSKLIPLDTEKRVSVVNDRLDKAKHVAPTVDIWTDGRMHSYIGVTAHTFVNCEAKSHLLHSAAIKGSHTGARTAAELEKLTEEHSPHRKVLHIVSDNDSNMRRAFELLRLKAMDDVDDEDDAAGADDMLSDEELLADKHEDGGNEVSQVIDRYCLLRLSCFADEQIHLV